MEPSCCHHLNISLTHPSSLSLSKGGGAVYSAGRACKARSGTYRKRQTAKSDTSESLWKGVPCQGPGFPKRGFFRFFRSVRAISTARL